MSEGFLSQEEIDSLLRKNQEINNGIVLSEIDRDILGEVGNISMATAATTLSTLLGKKVNITTPVVDVTDFGKIQTDLVSPKVVLQVKFEEGLIGNNILLMNLIDASIIANLMMGGDGTQVSGEMTEIEISAVSEAMNQMIGSASTSVSTMLNRPVNIYPPHVQIWHSGEEMDIEGVSLDQSLVKTSFRLTVEGLIDSEIMQIFTEDAVREIINGMMGITTEEVPVVVEETPMVEQRKPEIEKTVEEPVIVKKPQYAPLQEKISADAPRNIDLIMDVPLEFSVVLGKTQKPIRDVLALNPGSIIELNKFAEEPLEIYVNGKLIAQGEVVIINENFGVRITNILSAAERVKKLK